ncbi:hypothetical protein RhiirA5_424366 [Rhizophagus irregularis]|uniref:Uncharacterized protein n=1 Tax=Rhizophagus irregularis TaxID=588596 RepID=A0A2N0P888_9GLOM|nr:hypothetical protein RhiirA5_424366 [Rhizophagus irregularis]CAB5197052.1 unnamed protein product [Rhizophagus irregularis]
MTTTQDNYSIVDFLRTLQDPAPQYVLGCGPAVATIGASPESGLINKLLWLLRCLGCPFTGLFYACVCNDPITMSIYWLTSDHFMKDENILPYRPLGHYIMKITVDEQDDDVIKLLEECIAEASVLDRLSSLASAYYIFLGIITGLIKAMRIGQPCPKEDWPYLPLALAWTLPAIYKRVYGGRMVVNDPRDRLKDMHLVVSDLKHRESHKRSARVAQVMIILLFSIIIHWISVLLAYFTYPVGYGCRSRYLTVLSSIWSFNNLIAYISHIIGERSVEGNRFIHGWFCLCGVTIFILLILLGLLSHTQSWWKDLFGNICDDAARCKM